MTYFAAGAAQPKLGFYKIKQVKVPNPPLDIQQKIASILSSYDDLIENNLKRIKLLEESAQLLYKEWFVNYKFPDYEKVKIKNGIPEGWQKKTIADMVEEQRSSIKPEDFKPKTPYVGLEHIPRKSTTLKTWGLSDDVQSMKFNFVKNDILFGKIRPYFHKVVLAPFDGICSSDTIILRTKQDIFLSFALSVISDEHFVEHATKTCKEGARMPRANWKVMQQYPIVLPTEPTLKSYDQILRKYTEAAQMFVSQNIKLKEARDILLPRLMDGSIEV